ncbi:MAG TPA: heavy-metal-associated domain-containing protein [Desulfosalsimonadaceae bacterium]|nr:heavy-metal-associated domain-containing protein [Desulfosalsimonadaceae bacterium]
MATQKFSVPNISCDHCVNTIRNELKELEGINLMDGDVANKQITVEYEGPASEEKIREKLKEINYPAE